MKTFSEETKQMLLDRIAAHERADEIVSDDRSQLANLIGIDVRIAFVVDRIFEGLPDAEANTFPRQFIAAIPTDTDLALTWPRFAYAILADKKIGVVRFESGKEINNVARLYRRWIFNGKQPASELFAAAADAAYATSSATRTAAYAAGAAARTVGDTGYAAALAASSAARTAAYAAGAAARTVGDTAYDAALATSSAAYAALATAWQSQRDLILKLMRQEKLQWGRGS